jgi:hypothetical protein
MALLLQREKNVKHRFAHRNIPFACFFKTHDLAHSFLLLYVS